MPYIIDKIAIDCEILDRRTKILSCQRLLILDLHTEGMGIRAIARRYKVDKRIIQFILFPDRKKKNLKDRELRGGTKYYYDKEKHKESTKDHRYYKHSILKLKKQI